LQEQFAHGATVPCITSISALKMVAHIEVGLQRRLLTKIGTILQQMHALCPSEAGKKAESKGN
jgi:hypothetical protein